MATSHPEAPSFIDLGVPAGLAGILAATGRTTPFPIQAATLPDSLAGRDVLGRGRTGSGKTLAFALPVVARLAAGKARRQRRPRALILAPTRELATQIKATVDPLAEQAGLTCITVFGGVGERPQIAALRRGADIVVACPGRLHALVRDGHADLGGIAMTVLDEADHMADLGFLPTVRALLAATPAGGQRLLFSATLDRGVDVLVKQFLTDPVTHSVDPPKAAVTTLTHEVLQIEQADRVRVVAALTGSTNRTVVFTRTKHGAKKLAKQLCAAGVTAVELHGNLGQNARTRNLAAFGDGTASTLVATDIAARGIHIDDVGLVVHADPPVEHKAYLHRSGRTGRAGASGTVITLMTGDQRGEVRDLTRQAGINPGYARVEPGAVVPEPGTIPPSSSPAPSSSEEPAPAPRQGRSAAQGSRTQGSRTQGSRAQGSRTQGSRTQNGRTQHNRAAQPERAQPANHSDRNHPDRNHPDRNLSDRNQGERPRAGQGRRRSGRRRGPSAPARG